MSNLVEGKVWIALKASIGIIGTEFAPLLSCESKKGVCPRRRTSND